MGKPQRGKIDFSILVLTLIPVLFGCVMVYSASYYTASIKYGNGAYYFTKQLLGAGLGVVAIWFFANFDFRNLERLRYVILAMTVILLGAVFLPSPIGVSLNGSSRWINIGVTTLQPAEIAKFASVIYLSYYFSRYRDRLHKFWRGTMPGLLVVGVLCVLILLQPNFSMIMCIAIITGVMMFAAGVPMKHMVMIVLVGVAAAVVAILIEPYRIKRVFTFLDPWSDTSGDSYQLIQSFYAFGSGGLFGKGLGRSQQKLLYLPYSESDFIFAIIAEELGFVGVVALLLVYGALIWRGVRVALTCPNRFGSLLATGITAMIAIQVLINLAVVTGSIPPTGQTLPFISAGTSSLLIFMSAMGVLLNISRYTVKT